MRLASPLPAACILAEFFVRGGAGYGDGGLMRRGHWLDEPGRGGDDRATRYYQAGLTVLATLLAEPGLPRSG